jgi:3-methyladenine DNA glycosylase AlkD
MNAFIREIITACNGGPALAVDALIRDLRRELRRVRVRENAAPMQAYMKSEMPFLGVQTKPLRAACRKVFGARPIDSFDEWRASVLAIWRGARFREERYAAIELTGSPAYREFQLMKTLPMYAEMISTGAWWDVVDPIATQRLGGLLRRYPGSMSKKMRAWSGSRDIWRRRSSIICQVKFKDGTDVELMFDCIRPSMGEKEFFLRKAIGWALREYAKVDPKKVKSFVRRHEQALSGLSKREALKHVGG